MIEILYLQVWVKLKYKENSAQFLNLVKIQNNQFYYLCTLYDSHSVYETMHNHNG